MDAAYADSRWSNGHLYPEGWADFEDGLKLAAPVIAEAAYRAGIEAGTAESVLAAVRQIAARDPGARILICGSLYLAGGVLRENG